MKTMISLLAMVTLGLPMAAYGATVTCTGYETHMDVKSSGALDEVGQTIHADFVDTDVAFGHQASIECTVEKTPSGIYCVQTVPGITYVLTLTHVRNSETPIVLTEHDHGGYGSEDFNYPMTCE